MIRQNSKVQWKWADSTAEGKVLETYTSKVTKTIKNTEVTRNGSSDNKALFIEQSDGDRVLKLESEVEHITQ